MQTQLQAQTQLAAPGTSILGEINSSVCISLSIDSRPAKVTPCLLPLSFHLKLNNNCFGVWSPAEARADGLETAPTWLTYSGPGLVTMPRGKVEPEQDSKTQGGCDVSMGEAPPEVIT